ncbi:MAG TPA: hypothetical protein IAD02_02195 [Candidatus Enterousia intestinigallinarum]|uniref:IncF plasmid conjugative transfer protein TraN n=1 Tax=Candidatus Enterousia intestinigallinarum TaxID=2840790 RepID=A0A9D1JWE5_9PROT|nr:hypothetical protein [Candidatus Enterousia intestinigallinarum]
MKIKVIIGSVVCLTALAVAVDSYGLTMSSGTKRQSAIQQGTTVRTKVEATGLYDQACYDAYFGCMDQFCITDNASGGACNCSDNIAEYDKELAAIQDILSEANRLRTEEIERVKAGADADIIFTGERRYDEDGNILAEGQLSEAEEKAQKRADLLALFNTSIYEDSSELESQSAVSNMADMSGAELYNAANELCLAQVPDSCAGDIVFLQQLYSRQITSDCLGYKNSLAQQRTNAENELAAAESEVRTALQESFDSANKYDLGQCMVEFKKCMQTDDACGEDWENCVMTIASENMQNNTAASTAGTTVETVDTYDITASTMEMLSAKRPICENVLDQCVAVRDQVWPNFLREAAPTIKVAESIVESKFRQSCLTNISECIQTACRDDIAGKGIATMDACLSRPEMARSFCKVEIDPCERMEPLIWGYVEDKLAAMRVDACTQEVKDCFTADTRCGPNFENCIGMDYDYIHDICPIDSLVVCKANNPNFSMDDLDDMLMGLYLNIDNAMMEQCQNIVDQKMAEVCGSTSDCNRFAADDTIGTGSLRSQKDGTTYRVTGMISFGSIKMGDSDGETIDDGEGGTIKLGPGEIGVSEYIAKIRESNAGVENAEGIISAIEEELNNIAGTINRTIDMIAEDPEIQYCVNGRDLSQITGEKNASTTGRFPNLLNQVKMQIAISALRQAQDNYNTKLNYEIAEATKNASTDLAQYMCQKIAENGGAGGGDINASTPLTPPYAISYDVGSGLTTEDLAKGGAGVLQADGVSFTNSGYLGGSSMNGGGMTKTVRAIFSRDTRTCHICTQTVTQDCKTTGSSSWFHNNRNTSCTTNASEEVCEDIVM